MGVISYEVPINVQRMTIGVQGENNVREFLFDVTEWRKITGDIGAAEMVVQRNGDASPYAAVITMHDENTVSWIPTSTDTEKVGAGKLQLMWIAGGQAVKTKIFDMKVDPSLDYAVPDTSLDPWASWMPDVINAAVIVKEFPGSVADATADWLEEHIGPTTPAIDKSLSIEGAGADAKKTGEEIADLKSALDSIEGLDEQLVHLDEQLVHFVENVPYDNTSYYYYKTATKALSTEKKYILKITFESDATGRKIYTGTAADAEAMVDTVYDGDFIANKPVYVYNYTPSVDGIKYFRSTGNAEWTLLLYESEPSESIETYNLLDDKFLLEKKIINSSGNVVNDNTGAYYAQYIPVDNTDFVVVTWDKSVTTGTRRIYLFNSSKVLQSRNEVKYGVPVSIPSGIKYATVQCTTSDFNVQLVYGDAKKGYVKHKTANDMIARNMLDMITEPGRNLFNNATLKTGYIKNDSGNEVADSASSYFTQYIELESGESYCINFGAQRIYEYDSSKGFLRRTSAKNDPVYGVFVCPSDVKYIQIQIKNTTDYSEAQVEHGTQMTPYIAYGAYTGVDHYARASAENYYGKSANLFPTITYWEPDEVDTEYSNQTSGSGMDTKRADWEAEDKYLYYEFLEHYYDTYLGTYSDGYRVTKKSFGQDGDQTGHELFEYDFCPLNYKYTVLLSAGMNADETQGIWGLATLMRCIMNKEDSATTLMRDNIRFKVIPIINASGFDKDTLRYNYIDDVNPNFNFNYKDSWERQTAQWAYKGPYPDSNIATVYLKNWVNENAWKADLWIDIHTGRWNTDQVVKQIIDVRVADSSMVSMFTSTYLNAIKDYYIAKGYITASDNIGGVNSIRNNLDYQKTVYAYDVCGIKSMMTEMHIESTGYGTDGHVNNSANGIKCYVGQLRLFIMCYINNSTAQSLKLDSEESVIMHSRY